MGALNRARVRWITQAEATRFMERYEHLGNVGLGVWHVSMDLNGDLASVLSFGTPCFSVSRGALGLIAAERQLKLLQLCRGGTSDHAPRNSASRAVALALREVRRRFGDSLVVAYADPKFGELGTIYQACNAVHTGWTQPKGQAEYIIDGRRMSGWVVRKRYGTRDRQKLRAQGLDVEVLLLPPKLRYVFVTAAPRRKRAVLKDLEAPRAPYPTRESAGIESMKTALAI